MTPSRHSEVRTRPDRATRVAPAGRARAEERAVAEVCGVAAGAIGRSSRREPVEEAFGVEPAKELDGDENVSICGSRDDRRRKIVAPYYSKGVARPAEAYTDSRLGGKSNFIGLDRSEEQYIRGTGPRSANARGYGIGARPGGIGRRRGARCRIISKKAGARLRRLVSG